MEIKNNNKVVITGKHIMIVSAVICLCCCAYWLYCSFFCQDEQWQNATITAVIGIFLLFLARKRR